MLFMTLDARRKHAVSTICVDNIVFKDDKVILLPSKTLKHSKSTTPLQPLICNAYKKNIKLCLVNCHARTSLVLKVFPSKKPMFQSNVIICFANR